MFPLFINLSIIEVTVLLMGAGTLGWTIRFFIKSQRSLKEAMKATTKHLGNQHTIITPVSTRPKAMERLQAQIKKIRAGKVTAQVPEPVLSKQHYIRKDESVDNLKDTILKQQKLLGEILKQVEEIEYEGNEEMLMENKHLQKEIETLEVQLDKKNGELEEIRHQASMAERMAAKIEDVYIEFEQLQTKMAALETAANRANNLAIELEDTRQAYEQIHKDLQRKSDKLEETFTENQRMQQELNALEDKLAEANLQRGQLHKKIQFLQELNTDLQSVSDTNKKLQTELRRIAELESMLTMIAEERDYLLSKQANK